MAAARACPTVIIRPGKPNAAASGFASAVFREPLNGEDYVLPVGPDTVMPVLGYRSIVEGLLHLHELPGDDLGSDRAVSLPALTVTVTEMMEALNRVAHNRALGAITIEPDPFIEAICRGWPQDTEYRRALSLGASGRSGGRGHRPRLYRGLCRRLLKN